MKYKIFTITVNDKLHFMNKLKAQKTSLAFVPVGIEYLQVIFDLLTSHVSY